MKLKLKKNDFNKTLRNVNLVRQFLKIMKNQPRYMHEISCDDLDPLQHSIISTLDRKFSRQ